MSDDRRVHVFDYVHQPYDQLRRELIGDTTRVFRDATRAATVRANKVATELHVHIAGLELSTNVTIRVTSVREVNRDSDSAKTTQIDLEWESVDAPRMFPLMRAELSIYPLTRDETQLDFLGHYTPPLGPLGTAIDAMVGHRIAEATVHRFLAELTTYLRQERLAPIL